MVVIHKKYERDVPTPVAMRSIDRKNIFSVLLYQKKKDIKTKTAKKKCSQIKNCHMSFAFICDPFFFYFFSGQTQEPLLSVFSFSGSYTNYIIQNVNDEMMSVYLYIIYEKSYFS